MRPVIITTEHRGVFFGRTAKDAQDIVDTKTVSLSGARMAIYWGTTQGVMQLAHTGPTDKSKIGARADITLNAVTAVIQCTPEAAAAWDAIS